MKTFQNKKIILGICASIAAYKAAELVRLLTKQGAQVQVVMTHSALEFVGALSFQALSGRAVRSDLFDLQAEAGMSHIELARWAELIIIAPITANSIAKLAHGLADNLLSSVCLASRAPLLLAPAMNQQMWQSDANLENIARLLNRKNVSLCGPAKGEQACGDVGDGRLEEPGKLLDCARQVLLESLKQQDETHVMHLSGIHLLITAGPTIEDIDSVRYVSNRSSGKMGYAIAQAAVQQGAQVTLISGPVAISAPDGMLVESVRSAQQMYDAVFRHIQDADIFIASAAVADYRPVNKVGHKIKKDSQHMTLELVRNPDILAQVAALPDAPLTIGFAAETNDLKQYAQDKLKRKQLDMIVANKVGEAMGFEVDSNELHLFWPNGAGKKLPFATKQQLARQLIDEIVLLYYRNTKKP